MHLKIESKVVLVITIAFLVQVSCYAPQREYSNESPIPVEIQTDPIVKRGQEIPVTLATEPGVTCFVIISFWNKSNKWAGKDLPATESDTNGICQWKWKIPDDAKDGIVEIRGFVEKDERRTDFIPKTFCVEVCAK